MVYSTVRVELNDRFTVVLTVAVGCVHLYLHYSVPGGPIAVPLDPGRGEDWILAEGFRSDMLVWLRLEGLRVASRCHLRDPLWFNGRSWKPPSRATSSPTSPCATSRSTARISWHDL
jgi:hypothetical protein